MKTGKKGILMETMRKFAQWLVDHDKRIMVAHLKQEKQVLKRELREFEETRDKMRAHLHRIENLIEREE